MYACRYVHMKQTIGAVPRASAIAWLPACGSIAVRYASRSPSLYTCVYM